MILPVLAAAVLVLSPLAAAAQGRSALPRGLFAESEAQCDAAREGRENGARFISRDGKTIETYASTCRVKAAKASGAAHTLQLSCEAGGAGQDETVTIRVVDRNTVDWQEDDARWTLKRCPE